MHEAPSVEQYVNQHDEQSSLILWEQISGHNTTFHKGHRISLEREQFSVHNTFSEQTVGKEMSGGGGRVHDEEYVPHVQQCMLCCRMYD